LVGLVTNKKNAS